MERSYAVLIVHSAERRHISTAATTTIGVDVRFYLNPERYTLLAAMLFGRKFGGNAVHLHVHADLLHRVPEHLDRVEQVAAGRLHLHQPVRQRDVHVQDALAGPGRLPELHLLPLHVLQPALVEAYLDNTLQNLPPERGQIAKLLQLDLVALALVKTNILLPTGAVALEWFALPTQRWFEWPVTAAIVGPATVATATAVTVGDAFVVSLAPLLDAITVCILL
uniref:Uncharacterized protein n=1 Tax=Anopheles coluzzii TaxID=1518534 RepID=A0A8W7PH03_ANOCL